MTLKTSVSWPHLLYGTPRQSARLVSATKSTLWWRNNRALTHLPGCLVAGMLFLFAHCRPFVDDARADGAVAPDGVRITLKLENVSIHNALKRLFEAASLKYSIDPAIDGMVNVSLADARFELALRSVLDSNSTGPLICKVENAVYKIAREPTAPVAPPQPRVDYAAMATTTINDLLKHFWVGSSGTGHIADTNESGYGGNDHKNLAKPGVLWERATFVSTLANYYQITKDPTTQRRIRVDWNYLTEHYSSSGLTLCGKLTRHWALDDSCWSATMYWNIYRVTGDQEALKYAERLFTNAYERWADGKPAQGLWYDDERNRKASVQSVLLLVGLRLFETTRDRQYLERVLAPYQWLQKTLKRDDGLYWCEYDANGPRHVGAIAEGSSDTFLGANMAMAVVAARLYRDTGDESYKTEALRVADSIVAHEVDGTGHLLNDRDAWADGYLMGEWAREVTTLPGAKHGYADILRSTASAIYEHARSPEGYYGPCWNGPIAGAECPWLRPGRNVVTRPEQIMTSCSTANVIMAAAMLDAQMP